MSNKSSFSLNFFFVRFSINNLRFKEEWILFTKRKCQYDFIGLRLVAIAIGNVDFRTLLIEV